MTEHEKTLRAIYDMLNQTVQFTPNDNPTVQILRGDCAAVRHLIKRTIDDAALDRGALEHAAWYDTSAELA